LKAATEILDRAGVRGGVEIDTNVNVEMRPAAEIIAERLDRLAMGAMATAARLAEEHSVIDAEVVVEDDAAPSTTFDEVTEDEQRPAATTSEREE